MVKHILNTLIAISLLLLTTAIYAEEEGQVKVPIEVTGDSVEFLQAEQVMVANGNVVITHKDMKMTCDSARVYMRIKKAVAKGNVRLTYLDKLVTGDHVEYNFEKKTGEIVDVGGYSAPWHFGTHKATKVSEEEYIVEKGFVTTSDYDKPEYQIKAKTIKFYPGQKIVAKKAVLYIGRFPVMYIPFYTFYFTKKQPKISIVPGKSKDWGYYLLTAYKYYVSDYLEGYLRFDSRTKRGFAGGIDGYYNTKLIGKGLFKYYFANDMQKHLEDEHRKRKERFRIQLRHRWDIDPQNTIIAEIHRYKDEKMIKDFFYREEYEEDNKPPTYIYGVHADEEFWLWGQAQMRVNKFEKVTQRLPEVGADIKEQRMEIMDLYYKGSTSVAHFNNLSHDKLKKDDVFRADSNHKFSYSIRMFDALTVIPFSGIRGDLYSRLQDDHGVHLRSIFYTGVNLSTKFYGYYPWQTNFLGMDINKVRHIITPTMQYLYRAPSTIEENKIIQSDIIDELTMASKFRIGLVNKFQTKRDDPDNPGNMKTVDFIRFFAGTEYWMRGEGRSGFKNILAELEFRPWTWLGMESDAVYNPGEERFDTATFDLVAEKGDHWKFAFGHRYENQVSSRLVGELTYKLNPKWATRIYESFELDDNDFVEQEYSIQRDLHSWTAEAGVNISGPYGTTFYVIFRLKAFPDIPFSFKTNVSSRQRLNLNQ